MLILHGHIFGVHGQRFHVISMGFTGRKLAVYGHVRFSLDEILISWTHWWGSWAAISRNFYGFYRQKPCNIQPRLFLLDKMLIFLAHC